MGSVDAEFDKRTLIVKRRELYTGEYDETQSVKGKGKEKNSMTMHVLCKKGKGKDSKLKQRCH